jgi:hypothetical protein
MIGPIYESQRKAARVAAVSPRASSFYDKEIRYSFSKKASCLRHVWISPHSGQGLPVSE